MAYLMLSRRIAFVAVVAIASASVYPVPTVVVPSEFIPLGKTANYTCVFDGKFVQWLVRVPGVALLALIPNGSVVIANIMSGYGIATDFSSPFVLTVNASYLNNGTILECTSVSADVATLSSSVVINVFGTPDTPSAVSITPAGMYMLELSWKPTFSFPGVNTSYEILVSMPPSKQPTSIIGPIMESHYTYRLPNQSSPCSLYTFSIVAKNGAGQGYPSQPLITSAPAVPQLGTLQSKVEITAEHTITVNLSFLAAIAKTCEEFPVEGYYVNVVDDITGDNLVEQLALYNTSTNASDIKVVLHTSDGLQPNVRYICSILAYNTIGMSTPSSIVVYTTDVQSSTITGSGHQLNVTCFFAEGTQARGCAVCLEKSGEVVCQMVPRVNETAKGVIRTEFSVDCYNISVVDWEEDGSIGSLGVPVNSSVKNKILECEVTVNPDAFPELVYVITGVAIAGAIIVIAALIIAIGICSRKCRTKQAELTRNDVPSSTSVPNNGHQRTDHTTLNTFASDPVYSSSILYMGITRTSKLPNEKVAAVDTLSRQWEANLTPPTSSTGPYQHLATPTSSNRPPSVVDYSRLHRQNTGDRRFSIPSSSSNPPPHPLTISGTIPLPHHLPMGHPHQLAIGESPVYATPTQQRPSSVSGQGRSVGHEYETPLEQQGRWRGGVSEERLREDGAFTDV